MGADAHVPLGLSRPPDVLSGRLRTAPGVLVRHWGEETAVAYVTATAATHLLDAAAAGILQFCVTPRPASELPGGPAVIEALLVTGLLQPAP